MIPEDVTKLVENATSQILEEPFDEVSLRQATSPIEECHGDLQAVINNLVRTSVDLETEAVLCFKRGANVFPILLLQERAYRIDRGVSDLLQPISAKQAYHTVCLAVLYSVFNSVPQNQSYYDFKDYFDGLLTRSFDNEGASYNEVGIISLIAEITEQATEPDFETSESGYRLLGVKLYLEHLLQQIPVAEQN